MYLYIYIYICIRIYTYVHMYVYYVYRALAYMYIYIYIYILYMFLCHNMCSYITHMLPPNPSPVVFRICGCTKRGWKRMRRTKRSMQKVWRPDVRLKVTMMAWEAPRSLLEIAKQSQKPSQNPSLSRVHQRSRLMSSWHVQPPSVKSQKSFFVVNVCYMLPVAIVYPILNWSGTNKVCLHNLCLNLGCGKGKCESP